MEASSARPRLSRTPAVQLCVQGETRTEVAGRACVAAVGEEEISSTLRGFSSWSKNQIDLWQINRRKKTSLIMPIWGGHRNGFRIRENEVYMPS